MLSQYKNIDRILTASGAINAERYTRKQLNLFNTGYNSWTIESGVATQPDNYKTELHIYSGDVWLTGNHHVQHTTVSSYYDESGNQISLNQPISINLYNELQELGVNLGTYTYVLNFFKNLIGNYDTQYLKIQEISPDRTELKLKLIDNENSIGIAQLASFADNIQNSRAQTNISNDILHRVFLLNFSQNKTVQFVNSVVNAEYLYVKLIDPLPDDIEVDFRTWVVEERKQPVVDTLSIIPESKIRTFNQLKGANWDAIPDSNISTTTDFNSWTNILTSGLQTSQQIIDSQFSGSLRGMTLNIDYSDFNNFVFYGSAASRIENFRIKLESIEYYTSQSILVSQISGSVAATNTLDFQGLTRELIGSFDNFEKFLYYESSSIQFNNEIPHPAPTVSEVTGSYITPVPKINSNTPYENVSVNSNTFETWYTNLLELAIKYDSFNFNSLINTLPYQVQLQVNKSGLISFIYLLGQHYDILYTYISNMTQINSREENPKLGMPNELLYSVAKQFGWNLIDGKQGDKLSQYLLGVNENGVPITGSNSITGTGTPTRDITFNTWRRIVNNIPGLLKSKGTKRSIHTLLACYGIPQSLITIKEYGGPRINRKPVYEKLNFDYALDLINNTSGTITVDYSQSINSVELRFRTDNVLDNPLLPNTMHLYSIGNNDVTIDFQSGTYGNILINGTASAAFEMFNGDWINTILRTSGSLLEIEAKKSKYGKIVSSVSASATSSFSNPGTLSIGGTSPGAVRLQGQLQELRLWNTSLENEPFANHTKAPSSYDGNINAYDELVFRLPLTQKINHTFTSSITGVEPNLSTISASFSGWSTDEPYDSIEEIYYHDAISLAAGTYDDNKIRLTDNELIGNLDVATRGTRAASIDGPIDSKKLGVYFSPQTMIDEDIISQLGFTILDDYIGDPGNNERFSYPRLTQQSLNYWKKYEQSNDINSYIRIFSLFDLSFFHQIKQLIPARVDSITGVLIQPNLLERSKDTSLPTVERHVSTYEMNLDLTNSVTNTSADFNVIDTSFNILSDNFITSTYEDITGNIIISSDSLNTTNLLIAAIQKSALSEVSINTSGDPAEFQDYLPIGLNNLYYNGTKISSPDFNISSGDTIDNGPVVETTIVNGNQIINVNSNQNTGNFNNSITSPVTNISRN